MEITEYLEGPSAYHILTHVSPLKDMGIKMEKASEVKTEYAFEKFVYDIFERSPYEKPTKTLRSRAEIMMPYREEFKRRPGGAPLITPTDRRQLIRILAEELHKLQQRPTIPQLSTETAIEYSRRKLMEAKERGIFRKDFNVEALLRKAYSQ